MNIEPLEPRIAPASLTFTDVDGDDVVISTTGAGALTLGVNVIVTVGQLQMLDLTSAAFQNASVSIVATRDPVLGGDGRVNVGSIDASGRDLGRVLVDGDLGQLFAGSGTDPARGLASLSVVSLGRHGTSTGAPGLAVNVDGRIGSLAVRGDVIETLVVADTIGKVTIGGSLFGAAAAGTGTITATERLGAVSIKGSIVGGGGADSGAIVGAQSLGSVSVSGSVFGGAGPGSGAIASTGGAVGPVKIGGNLRGGDGVESGQLRAATSLGSVTIVGSLVGGDGDRSGQIFSLGSVGLVKIGGNVDGGRGKDSGRIFATTALAGVTLGGSLLGGFDDGAGNVTSGGAMGPVKIAGNLEAGSDFDTGYIRGGRIASLTVGGSIVGGVGGSGEIRATDDIGAISVKGSLLGAISSPVKITARGQATPGATSDVAIKSLSVGGSVEFARIQIGFDRFTDGVNGDAQIGPVTVGGDWIASRIAAGTDAGADSIPGTDDDTFLGGGSPAILSRIASIVIGGQALGTPGGTDSFRFMAEKIGAFKVGGTAFPLTSGANNLFVGTTGDLRLFDSA